MAHRVILHIGLQKSGTTYLQKVLQSCGAAVADAGISYPLPAGWRRRRTVESHEWATYGLLGTEYPWVSQRRADNERTHWNWLLRQVRKSRRPVLLSAEALSVIRTPAIHRFVDALAADTVEVVVTARSLGRTLPSLWQQHLRNGRGTSFASYLAALAEQRDRPAGDLEGDPELHLWRAFAIGGLVRRWADVVGPDRVRVITTAGSPPRVLWSRFVRAIDAPGLADIATAEALDMPTHASLTAPEATVLLWLNSALAQTGWDGEAPGDLRDRILTRGFAERSNRGPKIFIPESWRERVARWSEADIAALDATGVTTVGNLADLRYEPTADTTSTSSEQICAASAAAILAAASRD